MGMGTIQAILPRKVWLSRKGELEGQMKFGSDLRVVGPLGCELNSQKEVEIGGALITVATQGDLPATFVEGNGLISQNKLCTFSN